MEISYVVQPMSAKDIEINSIDFLLTYEPSFLFGIESTLDMEKSLDDIFIDKGFCLRLISDGEMPKEIWGCAQMDLKIINIRESDYNNCADNGLARMSIAHEIGHARLQSTQICETRTAYRFAGHAIPRYMNSEWQANVWGSATLMPYPRVLRLAERMKEKSKTRVISEMTKVFAVTKAAAKVRLETLLRYKDDGRSEAIERELAIRGVI